MAKTHGTRADGTPITDETIESLADEAERGYDVAKIVRRRSAGRPAMGEAPASVESVRLDPELKRDLILRAADEHVSVSEVIRRALREYVKATDDGSLFAGRAAFETFRAAFETSACGMSFVDDTLRYQWVNFPVCAMLGRSREELLGSRVEDAVDADQVERVVALFDRLRRGELRATRDRIRFRRPDGTVVWMEVGGSAVAGFTDPLYLLQQFDVTAEQALAEDLAFRAMHDELTGLANRAHLRDRLRTDLARSERTGSRVAVFYLDLDHFRAINDEYGHAAGDTVLVEVARRLTEVVRSGDTVARVGGDEFVVAGTASSVEEASQLAMRIEAAMRPRHTSGGRSLPVTASVGVALNTPGDTPEELVARADLALLRVKRLESGVLTPEA